MSFNTAVSNAVASWFDSGMTTAVTYNGADILAHVEYLDDLYDDRSGISFARASLEISKNDVAAPDYDDAVVIGSTTWKVRSKFRGDDVSWLLEIVSDERPRFRK